ncbi:MAG: Undecaprenyl diphosphate synthase [uncultured Thermomicrobiales bacterium]|uniref:Isoprenyl transferase n=1 Tax=uncultured Thermomicrobiales bacterium TaxID=1645740 RepID=A0A6J4VIW6_9BACT|nr:MAG: Undecaprenyl diphosphate synthase [uncultured Thermomicrobiales bacterium]
MHRPLAAPRVHEPEPAGPESGPRHVAIIMDGNGRWAAQRGMPRIAGHERGTENIRRITEAAVGLGIRYLTLWAFSTENWRRPRDEIAGIMRILGEAIERETGALHERGAQLRHIGSLDGLAPDLQQAVLSAIELTRQNQRLVLTLAFNYGGRQELVSAVRSLVEAGTPADRIDEAEIGRHLYTRDLPDPDLIVRTSGEHRISNFLLWQAAYAELLFTPVLWPDFGPPDLQAAVLEYAQRDRRFGGVSARSTTAVG